MGQEFRWLAVFVGTLVSVVGAAETPPTQGSDHIVIDDVKISYGAAIRVEGRAYDVSDYRFDFVPAGLSALRINGKATQCQLHVQLITDEVGNRPKRAELQRFKTGSCYEIRGQLRNARFSGTRNVCVVEVDAFKPIPDVTLKCEDFVDRDVTFEGIAIESAKLSRAGELISIDGLLAWPETIGGKEVTVSGSVRRTESGWRLEQAKWSLIKLEDQVGQTVSLDGHLWSLNGNWWFDYRGHRLYLIRPQGPVLSFRSDDHGRPVRVSGLLWQQLRPSLEQISLKADRDLESTFVVRIIKIEFQDERTAWGERFGFVDYEANKLEDGIPVLIAESSIRLNVIGNETSAQLFIERNRIAINSILSNITAESLQVLTRRMNDGKTNAVLRLIYAAMLASTNDNSGRNYLLKMSKPSQGVLDLNALYCLGIVPFLAPKNVKLPVKMDWAEPTLIGYLNDVTRVKTLGGITRDSPHQSISDATLKFTSIPSVLANSGSKAGRSALFAHALTNRHHSSEIIHVLCRSKTPPTVEELLQLERISGESSDRRQLLTALLRANSPIGLDRFLPDFESGFVYNDLRDHLTPEVLSQLRSMAKQAKGESRTHIMLLMMLAEKDPIPGLIACLNDPKWIDKNIVLYELARLADPGAVRVVAKILREAPADYFRKNQNPEFESTPAIEHGLDAIARTGTADAIQELILLLKVDLARFGSHIDRAGLQRIVAADLIELTGESFGVDADAWQKWRDAHPEHCVKRELLSSGSGFRVNASHEIDLGK